MTVRLVVPTFLLLPFAYGGYDDLCDCLIPGDCSSAGVRPSGFFHGDEDDCCECLIPGVPASCVAACFDVTSGTCAELKCVAHDTCVIGTSRDILALEREGKTCGAVCVRSHDECEQLVALGGYEVVAKTEAANASAGQPSGDDQGACEATDSSHSSSPSSGSRWVVAVGTYTEAVADLPDHAVTCGGNPNPACGGAGVHLIELTERGEPKLPPSSGPTAPTLQTATATRSLIGPNPSFVEWHPSAPCVFATSELGERASTTGAVRVELDGLRMSAASSTPSMGHNPSSLAISADGHLLAVSYFLGGGVDLYEVDVATCELSEPKGLLDPTVAAPPAGGLMFHHVHFFPPRVDSATADASPVGAPEWLIAVDFGHDRLVALRAPLFDSDSAVATNLSDEASAGCASAEDGAVATYRSTMFCGKGVLGARHLAWGSSSPSGGVFAYVSLQRAQGVLALRFDPNTGAFELIGMPVLAGESCVEPSALHVAGNKLFLACRIDGDGGSHGFMLRFVIDPTTGSVAADDESESYRSSTRGAVPRDFKLVNLQSEEEDAEDPNLLAVVANQGSNSLFLLNASGDLNPVDFHPLAVPASVAVRQFPSLE